MATGLLPVFFGNATKACDILPIQDKRYFAGFQLGVTSDTEDIWGNCTPVGVQLPGRDAVEAALSHFRWGNYAGPADVLGSVGRRQTPV